MRKTNMKPVVFFGCVHIGHEDADLKLAKEYIRFAKEEKAHVILLADNHEFALPHKKDMMFSQNMNPQKQFEYGLELFKPVSHQIIGACTGNHTARATKVAGIDCDKVMAERLGYLDKYYPHQGFVGVKAGKHEYKIAFKHGTGVGSNTFGNCRALLRNYPTADVCATSHTHQLATLKESYWDVKKGRRSQHEITFVITGSMLDYPTYADEAGYSPQPKGFAIAWLDPKDRHVIVDVSGML